MTDWVEEQHRRIHGQQLEEDQKGGPGSGHYGHAGRPGRRGGSVPGSVAVSVRTGRQTAASPHKESELQRMARQSEEASASALEKVKGRGGKLVTAEEFNADPRKASEHARAVRRLLAGRSVRYTGPDDQIAATFTPLKHGDIYKVANAIDPGVSSIGLNVRLPNKEIAALNMTELELIPGKG